MDGSDPFFASDTEQTEGEFYDVLHLIGQTDPNHVQFKDQCSYSHGRYRHAPERHGVDQHGHCNISTAAEDTDVDGAVEGLERGTQ